MSFAPFFLARITNPATGTPASIRNSASAISNAARRAFLFRQYWAICDEAIAGWIDALDLCAAESGFPWYSVSKLEHHQLVSLRHLQHHTAQLADRLRAASNVGVRWVAQDVRDSAIR